MKVSELMTFGPKVVTIETPIEEAGAQMARWRLRHLPAVDAAGVLVGLVTDANVFRHGAFLDGDRGWLAFEKAFDALTCGDVAVEVDVVVGPEDPLAGALARLAGSSQDAVVVTDGDRRPVGIISEHDVVALAADTLDPSRAPGIRGIGRERVLAVDIESPATDVWDLMADNGVRHVVVTRGGAVAGVISLRDVLAEDVRRRTHLVARDLLRDQAVQCAPVDTPLAALAASMKRHKIGCVPLIDDTGGLVGIVTRRDLLEAVIATLGEPAR